MEHLVVAYSNNAPLFVLIDKICDVYYEREVDRRMIFRFENFYAHEGGCQEVVSKSWRTRATGGLMAELLSKLGNNSRDLAQWSAGTFGLIRKQVSECQCRLINLSNLGDFADTGRQLNMLMEK